MNIAIDSNARSQAFRPLPGSLKRLIWLLQNQQQQPSLTTGVVRAAMRVANIQLEELLPWVELSHSAWESYGETCLLDARKFAIVVRAWKPGDFSAIYSEGTGGWETIQGFGALAVYTYGLRGNHLSTNSRKQLNSGEILQINGGDIAQMGNIGHLPAISLHVRDRGSAPEAPERGARAFNLFAGEIQAVPAGVHFLPAMTRSWGATDRVLTGDWETTSRYYLQLRDRLRRILDAPQQGDELAIRKKLRVVEERIANLQPPMAA